LRKAWTINGLRRNGWLRDERRPEVQNHPIFHGSLDRMGYQMPPFLPPFLADLRDSTRKTRAAIVFLILPFVIAPPLWYWVFHVAGGWYVDIDLEPGHRSAHLVEMFILDILALAALAWFVALALFFLDGYRRWLTGLLLVPMGILALLGAGFFLITIQSYFRFSGRG
jgi:hypothetical protein